MATIEQIEDKENVAEAGWLTSTLLFPFKVLFVGLTYLVQLIGVIAMAVGPAVTGLGAFIWYVSGKARKKFTNYGDAKRADPRRAEEAKRYAESVAENLNDSNVRSSMRQNPRAADVLHDSLDDLGQGHAVAGSIVAIASADLPSSMMVTAATSTNKSLRLDVTKRLMKLLPGHKAGLSAFIWFASGLQAHDWITVIEATAKNRANVNAARTYVKYLKPLVESPKGAAALSDNPHALQFIQNAINQLI